MIAKTNNRSLLGTLNDFSFMLRWQLPDRADLDLVQAALELSPHSGWAAATRGVLPRPG